MSEYIEKTFMIGDEEYPCFIDVSDAHTFEEDSSVWVSITVYKPRYKQVFVDGKQERVLASHKGTVDEGFSTSTAYLREMAKEFVDLANRIDDAQRKRNEAAEKRRAERAASGGRSFTIPIDDILRDAK